MFQICKPHPLHYLHIHLGICLLMQNYPKVQLPSFCCGLATCYQHSPLQQTGFPASREESMWRRHHFCFSFFISALKHLQKLQPYSCNNPIQPNNYEVKYLVNASLIGNLQKCTNAASTDTLSRHLKSCIQYCASQKHVLPTCPSSRLRGPQLINRQCPVTLPYCSHTYQICCLLVLAVFIPKETS